MKRTLTIAAGVLVALAPAAQAQDVHQEIIQRLDRIEKLLRAGSSGTGGAGSGEGVRMVVNFVCRPSNQCSDYAKADCVRAGFSAGVVSRAEPPQYGAVRATEVTCVR